MARTAREVISKEQQESEYQSGTQYVPNPDYNQAQIHIANLRQELMNAQMQKMSIDSQYCVGYGCIAKAVSQIASTAVIIKINNTIEQATNDLSNIPMQLSRPVYALYQFYSLKMNVSKSSAINYHIIDKFSDTYYRNTFNVKEEKSFNVCYNLNSNDKVLYHYNTIYDKEENISDFEKDSIKVRISRILDQF